MSRPAVDFDLFRFARMGTLALKARGNVLSVAQHPRKWFMTVTVEGEPNEQGEAIRDEYTFRNKRPFMLSQMPEYIWDRVKMDWEGRKASVMVHAEVVR